MRRSFVLLLLFMGTNFVYTRNWNHILDSIYAIQNINIPNSPELFQLQFISYDKLRRDVKTELFSNIDKRDTLFIIELYGGHFERSYAIKWKRHKTDYISYGFKHIPYTKRDTLIFNNNREECLIPYRLAYRVIIKKGGHFSIQYVKVIRQEDSRDYECIPENTTIITD